jgi:tRNA U34 5-methylaminomethyl-2-thiouridine-forming methyltransferase MnmC
MEGIEIITTADGSHSLLNTALHETYHSKHGAVQESKHVFIREGLENFLATSNKKEIGIFEVGFGTGLNAWLTWQRCKELHCKIFYSSIESYPLQPEIWKTLNYVNETERSDFALLHTAPWNTGEKISDDFILNKINDTLQHVTLKSFYDIIYFDAFAPNKQPEMWELPILTKVVASLNEGGIFVTYCAKGQLKRDLKSLGLHVESLPGPPGKKEMVRAKKREHQSF